MYPQNISNACITRLRQLLFGVIVIGSLLSASFTVAQDLNIAVKLKVANGDIDGTSVVVIENGKEISQSTTKKKRVKLDLSFGHQYAIRFEKSGYVTKEVLVDTRNVPLHMREEYLDFGFEIELFKEIEYPQLNSDSLKMAQWQYITDYGMFDFERIDNCFASEKSSTEKKSSLFN